ncbi:MAG: D-2-hydroxyacid dehydrogenase [Clostridia bacterium]|nr:D-2-hydroxyacid dehydrogenase [Clostridia bacterium]
MKIVLTDCATLLSNNDLDLTVFEQFGKVEYNEGVSGKALIDATRDADMILCNKSLINKEVMDNAKKLKYIGLFATGYNNIDTEYAKERGITVCNAGSYSTDAVAQQTFAYILNHYSAIEKYDTLVKQGGWITAPTFSMLRYPTDELAGKTIGIIGFGSIGQKVAKIALAFDMRVLCFTRTKRGAEGVTFVDLDTLLGESDIITAHCPLNEQSKKMFNREAFSKMKKGSYFINTARGGILDEQALADSLNEGHLSGAAIDVLETEPMSKDCPLINAKNITITPHTAWAPLATRQRLMGIVADNISAFLEGKPKNVVNK